VSRNATQPWHRDPLEVDRFLDGELSPSERAHREGDVARDPSLARVVASRRAFLATLASAGAAQDRPGALEVAALEGRIRTSLARSRRAERRRRMGWGFAAAAVLLLGIGLMFPPGKVEATPYPVLRAEALLRDGGTIGEPTPPSATCSTQAMTSPWRFPPVEAHDLSVRHCREEGAVRTEALLYRIDELDVVGYVAVADPEARPSHDIGITRFANAVVFDVRLGGALYYLAVDKAFVDRRGSCAACHATSRDGQPNPHNLLERRVPTQG
jgi:hypothetical protein